MKVGKKVNKYKERYMQIPKTVEQMILRRERLAIQLDDAMNALDHWLDKISEEDLLLRYKRE